MAQQPEYLSEDDWQHALDQMCPWTTPRAVVEAHLDAAPAGKLEEAELTRDQYQAERQWLESENADLARIMGPEFADMVDVLLIDEMSRDRPAA